ncbi:MAG: methylated-DNA--[protein]-cysteine S-methyltransferase [Acidobacteriota bacterium]|jgi:methylated-DNA-[protein]-cysteine S-methyltransferase
MDRSRSSGHRTGPESCAVLSCPLGALLAGARDGALVRLSFFDSIAAAEQAVRAAEDPVPGPVVDPSAPPLPDAAAQLAEYFAGARKAFDLPLAPEGTEFQRRVWRALAEIPWGETRSYGDLARAVGRPGSARAIGGAMNRNPIAIVLPCHRIVGAGGALTGYGAGLDRKRYLLELERVLLPGTGAPLPLR